MRFKRLFAVFAAVLFGVSLASCSSTDAPKEEYEFKTDDNTSGGFSFSSININTDAVKKVFYIGEEFTADGLEVKANYRKSVDGSWETKQAVISTYSIDSSAFDSTAVGSYDILVGYREGNILSNVTYKVNVLPSVYDSLPVDSEYLAAITATFNAGNTFIKEQYVNDTYRVSRDKLSYKLITNKVKEGGEVESKESTLSYMEIAESNITHNIDYSKIGSYPVRITYEGQDIVIDGKTYKNKVTTFVILNVINPVKKIEKASTGDVTFVAAAGKPDYSNWTFKITRHVDVGEEIVKYSSDLFKIDGVSLLVIGNQEANVEYLGRFEGNSRPSVKVSVSVTESTEVDIKIYDNLSTIYHNNEVIELASAQTLSGVDFSGNTGVILGDNIKAEAKPRSCDNISFNTRCQIQPKSKSGALHFVLDKGATVVIYIASTGDDVERAFTVRNADGEEVASGLTSTKDVPTRFEFKASEAGTYTISDLAKAIYFYGAIIAFEK